MTEYDEPTEQPSEEPGYEAFWDFLEDGGFTFPIPVASRAFPYERDQAGRILREPSGRPRGGKVYRVESVDAKTGMRLTALADISRNLQRGAAVSPADVAKLNMDDDQEREFSEQVMGATYHEVIADGVDWPIIQKMVQYTYMYFAMGTDVANKAAREGLFTGGKAMAPALNRAERRAQPQDHQTRRTRRTQ